MIKRNFITVLPNIKVPRKDKDDEYFKQYTYTGVKEINKFVNRIENDWKSSIERNDVEYIGNYIGEDDYIRLFFDLDIKGYDYAKLNQIKLQILASFHLQECIKKVIKDITKCKNEPNVIYTYKAVREVGENDYKFSIHIHIPNLCIKRKEHYHFTNAIKKHLLDNPYEYTDLLTNEFFSKYMDTSVYQNKDCFHLIGSCKKDDFPNVFFKGNLDVGKFDNKDFLITYLTGKEEKINYEVKEEVKEEVVKKEVKKEEKKEIYAYDDEKTHLDKRYNLEFLNYLLSNISNNRADEYDLWRNVCYCIYNICKEYGERQSVIEELIHSFSKRCQEKYKEDEVDKFIKNSLVKIPEKALKMNYLIESCIKYDSKSAYRMLDNNYYNVKKEHEIHASKFTFYGSDTMYRDVSFDDEEVFSSKTAMMNRYENLYYYETDENGVPNERKKFINKWLNDENIKTYDKWVFKPDKPIGEFEEINKNTGKRVKVLNSWKGFYADENPLKKDKLLDITLFINHIKEVICSNIQEEYDYLIKYLARIIQRPYQKTNVLLLLTGIEGTGKNFFTDVIIDAIGENHSFITNKPKEDILGKFNGSCMDKIIILIQEASFLHTHYNELKSVITDKRLNYTSKGKDTINKDNYSNIIVTTNEINPMKISNNDRRVFIPTNSKKYVNDVKYFTKLAEVVEDEKFGYSLLEYLRNIPLTEYDFKAPIPMTKEKKELVKINQGSIIEFMVSENFYNLMTAFKNVYKKKECYVIKLTDVYNCYTSYCSRYKYTPIPKRTFESSITKEGFGLYDYNRYKVFRIYPEFYDKWYNKHNNTTDIVTDDASDYGNLKFTQFNILSSNPSSGSSSGETELYED